MYSLYIKFEPAAPKLACWAMFADNMHPSPIVVDRGIQTYGFEPCSSQTNNLNIDASCFLVRSSSLLPLARTGWHNDKVM